MSTSSTRFVTLMYHDVAPRAAWSGMSPSVTRYFVTPEQFRDHMRLLAAHARCLTLSEVLADADCPASRGPTAPAAIAERSPAVQLTFDDGWRGSFENTAETLLEYGWHATVFVTTGLIGHPLFVSEAVLRTLSARPFSIGAHSVSHAPLARLPRRRLLEELSASKRRLEDLTGRAVEAMSAPGGSVNRGVREAAAECGYRVLYTSLPRVNVLRGTGAGRAETVARRGGSDAEAVPLRVFGRVAITDGTPCEELKRFARGRLLRTRAAFATRRLVRRLVGEGPYAVLRAMLLGGGSAGADMDGLLLEASQKADSGERHAEHARGGDGSPSGSAGRWVSQTGRATPAVAIGTPDAFAPVDRVEVHAADRAPTTSVRQDRGTR